MQQDAPAQPLAASRKVQNAWAMYDWANSAYNLVITSTIFPAYYIAITGDDAADTVDYVQFFGWKVINSTLLDYALAFAYLVIAILSPILSSIADFKGNKKRYMQVYCVIGSLACMGLYFFKGNNGHPNVEVGIICSILAAIGYCGSLVFYNAYLPEIAPEAEQDRLSAKGYTYGYIGSVLLQLVCFAFIFAGFKDTSFAPRLSFVLVGLWWLGFAQLTFRRLPPSRPAINDGVLRKWSDGFKELQIVWQQVKQMRVLKTYLFAFFFYSMGVQTVMLAATIFGSKEIHKLVDGKWQPMEAVDLIPAILIIQLVAIAGAVVMSRLSQRFGNLKVLAFSVCLWVGICIAAFFTYTNIQFYILAVCVGLLMGGIQSLSRSTYSKLIPEGTLGTTSFFSLYDVMEKMSIVLGMFSFGIIEHIFLSMRYSILALILFFFIGAGLLILAILRNKK